MPQSNNHRYKHHQKIWTLMKSHINQIKYYMYNQLENLSIFTWSVVVRVFACHVRVFACQVRVFASVRCHTYTRCAKIHTGACAIPHVHASVYMKNIAKCAFLHISRYGKCTVVKSVLMFPAPRFQRSARRFQRLLVHVLVFFGQYDRVISNLQPLINWGGA